MHICLHRNASNSSWNGTRRLRQGFFRNCSTPALLESASAAIRKLQPSNVPAQAGMPNLQCPCRVELSAVQRLDFCITDCHSCRAQAFLWKFLQEKAQATTAAFPAACRRSWARCSGNPRIYGLHQPLAYRVLPTWLMRVMHQSNAC